MCCCFLNVSLIFPLLQITAQVVTSLEFISTNALQVWGGSSGHHDTVCNAACNIALTQQYIIYDVLHKNIVDRVAQLV